MTSNDTQLSKQINAYVENEYQRYIAWYFQNSKIAKNNLIVALGVVIICALCLVFFPSSMDQMSFFQYTFDPTNAIKIGLLISILLSIASMYTSFKQMRRCQGIHAQLRTEFYKFEGPDDDNAGSKNKAAFKAFKSGVDAIMAASNPEVVIAVEQDNRQKGKSSKA